MSDDYRIILSEKETLAKITNQLAILITLIKEINNNIKIEKKEVK